MASNNLFIDDENLSELSSLTHLLNKHEDHENTEEIRLLQHSPFYSEDHFSKLLSSKNGFSILDLNICNAFTKFDEFKFFVDRMSINNPISIICLNECWLNKRSNTALLQLNQYTMYTQIGQCPGHSHCGLVIYVHEQFQSHQIVLNYESTGWEYLCVEVVGSNKSLKTMNICNIYRPPELNIIELDTFIDQFSNFLNLPNISNKPTYLNGDFNINLLRLHNDNHVNTFFEFHKALFLK